jgi:hypothetical protein
MIHPRVTIAYQPAGATPADSIPAANQFVFIDVTAGTMTAAQTDRTGLLVGSGAGGGAIPLDDSRTYQMVISAARIVPPPQAASGVTVRVAAGRITVPPHIAVRVLDASGTAAAGLACALALGATRTNVTTSTNGWIISNDRSSGASRCRATPACSVPGRHPADDHPDAGNHPARRIRALHRDSPAPP